MSGDPISIGDLGAPEKKALTRLILGLADSKRLMGIRYSDWLLGAPSVETGIAASSMTQDEWGHARLLYAMLKECDLDPDEVEHRRDAEAYANVDVLDSPFEDWAAVVAGMVVVDGAITAALRSFGDGRCEVARTRVPKMIAEEEFHASLGAAWFRRLAGSGGEALRRLKTHTDSMLGPVLAWVGAHDDTVETLVSAGIIDDGASRMEAFRDDVRELLATADVDVDAARPSDEWDGSRGRGPGHPDADAIERARGDRNRMLFVE